MVVVNCTALSLMSFPTVTLSSDRSTCCPKSEISLSIPHCLALCHDSIGAGAEGVSKPGMARNGILPCCPGSNFLSGNASGSEPVAGDCCFHL